MPKSIDSILERMRSDLVLANRSDRTTQSYLGCARTFLERHAIDGCVEPKQVTEDDVRAFLLELREQGLGASRRKQYTAALKLLFRMALRRPSIVDGIPYPHVPAAKTEVLSKAEVRRLLAAETDPLWHTLIRTTYSCGLRVGEVVALTVDDIDSERMLLHVQRGKGAKPRSVPLSESLLRVLRRYWVVKKPGRRWLFPDEADPLQHIGIRRVQRRVGVAADRVGIRRHVTPHTLRHSFATHHLEDNIDIRVVQTMLGHTKLETTARYLHVSTAHMATLPDPFDRE